MSSRSAAMSALRQTLRQAAWAPALVFLLHVIALGGFAAYDLFPSLDIPMHFLGGFAISFFIGRAYRNAEELGLLGSPAPWLYLLAVPALASVITILWEFAEYLSDRHFGTHAQLGLEDTLGDMLLGITGSLAYLAVGERARTAIRPVPRRGV